MAQVVLDRPRILAIVGELVPAAMPQHVAGNQERKFRRLPGACHHPLISGHAWVRLRIRKPADRSLGTSHAASGARHVAPEEAQTVIFARSRTQDHHQETGGTVKAALPNAMDSQFRPGLSSKALAQTGRIIAEIIDGCIGEIDCRQRATYSLLKTTDAKDFYP